MGLSLHMLSKEKELCTTKLKVQVWDRVGDQSTQSCYSKFDMICGVYIPGKSKSAASKIRVMVLRNLSCLSYFLFCYYEPQKPWNMLQEHLNQNKSLKLIQLIKEKQHKKTLNMILKQVHIKISWAAHASSIMIAICKPSKQEFCINITLPSELKMHEQKHHPFFWHHQFHLHLLQPIIF